MDMGRFQAMVDRLERESAASPGAYRVKVALLALLGFGILALLLGAIGLGLVLLLGWPRPSPSPAARPCCCCSSWASC
jgi:hypothetical protein